MPDLLQSNRNRSCFWVVKTKTLIGHIGVFIVQKMVLFQKQKGDVSKCTISVKMFGGNYSWFCNTFFLHFGFFLYSFILFCSCFTSSCCCFEKLVCVFWLLYHFLFLFCLFFWGFNTSLGPKPSLLCFRFGLFCFVFFLFVLCLSFVFCLGGLRVTWGGPKGHLTWP